MTVNRRDFLKGAAAGAAGTALTGGVLLGGAHVDARADSVSVTTPSYPFHDAHQAGVITPPPADKQAYTTLAHSTSSPAAPRVLSPISCAPSPTGLGS